MHFLFQNNGVWNPWLLSAVENDDRMLRSKFFVVQMPGGGDTINCQMLPPGDSSCNKCLELTRT